MKKEVIAFVLFIIGIFLLGSSPSPTGAVIGIPVISSSFIGLIFFIASLILLVREERGLEKEVKNEARELLKRGRIPTKIRDLIKVARDMGYDILERSDKIVVRYGTAGGGYSVAASIPRKSRITRDTSRRILKHLDDYADNL